MHEVPTRLARAIEAGGEAGALVGSRGWEHTELGSIAKWPSTLAAAVSTCLATGFPMVVNWGRQLTQIYNDAAIPVYGEKHPAAMGRSSRTNFPEFWERYPIQAIVDGIFETARPFRVEDQRVMLRRHGMLEEAYFTFSISPLLDDGGTVLGILNTYVETTERVLGERRMGTLRRLAERAVQARRPSEACTGAIAALAANPYDLRFVLLYLTDRGSHSLSLAGATGVEAGAPAAPRSLGPHAGGDAFTWPFEEVLQRREAVLVGDLASKVDLGDRHGRTSPPRDALVLPLVRSTDAPPTGILIVGLSPRRRLDDGYRGFLELVAAQIATGIGSAEAYEEARERAHRLAEIDRAKDVFYSNVSHEFRTPLTLLLAPIEDLLREENGRLNEGQREALFAARRSAIRLRRLVNGLLDLASLEAGRLVLVPESTDLAQLTREIASTIEPSMASAGIRFVVDCPPLGRAVRIDRNAWETIVLNLLSNALNYTRRGAVTLRLGALDDRVRLVVSDTGAGIPPAVLPHIFDRFYRSPESGARSVEGTGLGLSLVREFARALGGDVRATSTPNEGSTFTVEVPFEYLGGASLEGGERVAPHGRLLTHPSELDASEPAPSAAEPLGAGRGRPRVLVVEDNSDMRRYLSQLLARDYEVHAVADGSAALTSLPTFKPDLVLSDVFMPGIDGLALVRALRSAPATRSIPAILITARTGEDATLEGLGSGADDFIVKPFFSRELRARVHTHIELARMRHEAAEAGMKDTFIGMVSHELRTPLTSIKLQVLLLSQQVDKATPFSARLDSLHRNITRMEALVDDLLSFSAIKAGALTLRRERADLVAVCQLAAEEQMLIAQRNVTVEVPSEPTIAFVDSRLVQQVVGNLLSNALKYSSPPRSVMLRLRIVEGEAVISVQDQGPGIPADVMPHLFEHFYRAPMVEVRSGSRLGLGLGLAICKAIVTAHGGRIEVESEIGRGSTFFVYLPLAPASSHH
jgi:signal transduction histidine kinase